MGSKFDEFFRDEGNDLQIAVHAASLRQNALLHEAFVKDIEARLFRTKRELAPLAEAFHAKYDHLIDAAIGALKEVGDSPNSRLYGLARLTGGDSMSYHFVRKALTNYSEILAAIRISVDAKSPQCLHVVQFGAPLPVTWEEGLIPESMITYLNSKTQAAFKNCDKRTNEAARLKDKSAIIEGGVTALQLLKREWSSNNSRAQKKMVKLLHQAVMLESSLPKVYDQLKANEKLYERQEIDGQDGKSFVRALKARKTQTANNER